MTRGVKQKVPRLDLGSFLSCHLRILPRPGTKYWEGGLPQGVFGEHSSAGPAASPEKNAADLDAFDSWV